MRQPLESRVELSDTPVQLELFAESRMNELDRRQEPDRREITEEGADRRTNPNHDRRSSFESVDTAIASFSLANRIRELLSKNNPNQPTSFDKLREAISRVSEQDKEIPKVLNYFSSERFNPNTRKFVCEILESKPSMAVSIKDPRHEVINKSVTSLIIDNILQDEDIPLDQIVAIRGDLANIGLVNAWDDENLGDKYYGETIRGMQKFGVVVLDGGDEFVIFPDSSADSPKLPENNCLFVDFELPEPSLEFLQKALIKYKIPKSSPITKWVNENSSSPVKSTYLPKELMEELQKYFNSYDFQALFCFDTITREALIESDEPLKLLRSKDGKTHKPKALEGMSEQQLRLMNYKNHSPKSSLEIRFNRTISNMRSLVRKVIKPATTIA